MAMEKNDFQKQQESINDFFAMFDNCIENGPSEDKCHLLLAGALKIARAIKDPVLADNFENKWQEAQKKFKPYADPTTLRFHEIEIGLALKKILAPARMEL